VPIRIILFLIIIVFVYSHILVLFHSLFGQFPFTLKLKWF
jgi:hypothetical protein